jgi:cytoskeletal protein CcmA (bactofilin family)
MAEWKKYELTEETRTVDGIVLHRIKARADFGSVKQGDLGGFIQSEENLSHRTGAADEDVFCGAWVRGEACVFGGALVKDYALVCGDAKVYGNAKISDWAMVRGRASIAGHVRIFEHARVHGRANVSGDVQLFGSACINGEATVHGGTRIGGEARIFGNAYVRGEGTITDEVWVYGYTEIRGTSRLSGTVRLSGAAVIQGVLDQTPIFIQGSQYWVGYCGAPGQISSGCVSGSIKWWREFVEVCAADYNYTSVEQKEYRLHIEHVAAWMKLHGLD